VGKSTKRVKTSREVSVSWILMDALAFQDKETLKSLMLSFDLLGIELVVFYYVSFFSSMQCYTVCDSLSQQNQFRFNSWSRLSWLTAKSIFLSRCSCYAIFNVFTFS